MALIEVKKYEAKFLGMPIGREPSVGAKKGKIIRSTAPEILGDVGDLDGKKDSPTYGYKSCVVGKTYILDQWQIAKYGAAFEVGKEVKGYVIDDGRTDEVEELARKQYKKDSADRAAKEEADRLKELKKEEAERLADEKKTLDDAIAAKEEEKDRVLKEEMKAAKKADEEKKKK